MCGKNLLMRGIDVENRNYSFIYRLSKRKKNRDENEYRGAYSGIELLVRWISGVKGKLVICRRRQNWVLEQSAK